MALETERKFIVVNDQWIQCSHPSATEDMVQGYINGDPKLHIENGKAWITLKSKDGAGTETDRRHKWKFEIPLQDANLMAASICDHPVAKVNHHVNCTHPDQADDAHKQHEATEGDVLSKDVTVRVRISKNVQSGNETAFLTFKGKRKIIGDAISRPEWEYQIPVDTAKLMQDKACEYSLNKTRHYIDTSDKHWTVDVMKPPSQFHNLALAEIEFPEGTSTILDKLPTFVRKKSEVTEDDRFTNKALAKAAKEGMDALAFLRNKISDALKKEKGD